MRDRAEIERMLDLFHKLVWENYDRGADIDFHAVLGHTERPNGTVITSEPNGTATYSIKINGGARQEPYFDPRFKRGI